MTGEEIVGRIEERLKQKGIRKGKFYDDIGITSATFSHWRNNTYTPSVESLKKINEYLGLNFGIVESEKPTSVDGLSEQERDLIDRFRSADALHRSAALAAALAVLGSSEQP